MFSIIDFLNYICQKAIKYEHQRVNIKSRTWWDSMRDERRMYEKIEKNWQSLMTHNNTDEIREFMDQMEKFNDQKIDALRLAFKSITIY